MTHNTTQDSKRNGLESRKTGLICDLRAQTRAELLRLLAHSNITVHGDVMRAAVQTNALITWWLTPAAAYELWHIVTDTASERGHDEPTNRHDHDR